MMNFDKELIPTSNEGKNIEQQDDNSEEFQDSMTQALSNIVILETIAKFLNVSDLLKARCVSTLWNLGTLPSVRQKFVVFLEMGGPKDKSKLAAFVDEIKALQPIRSCKIQMSTKSPHFSFYNNEQVMFEDLLYAMSGAFLSRHICTNFNEGDYAATCERELEAFNDILEHLSPSLEILEIGQEDYDHTRGLSHYRSPFSVRKDIKFPSLTKLIINHRHNLNRNSSWQLDKKVYETSYPSLFASAPNIQELRFERLDIMIGTVLDPLVNLHDKSRNWALLPKLTALSDLGLGYREGYRYLTDFPQTFTRLDLSNVRPELFPEFGHFLEKNKNSLVSLKLWDFAGEYEILSGSDELKIPDCFQNLEKLEIAFRDLEFDLKFEGGALNYARNFPALKKLSIDFIGIPKPKQIHKLKNLFDTFFPEQVFGNLRVLETDFDTLYSKYLEGVGINRFWHLQMFPNAKVKGLKFSASFLEAFEAGGNSVDILKMFPKRRFLS